MSAPLSRRAFYEERLEQVRRDVDLASARRGNWIQLFLLAIAACIGLTILFLRSGDSPLIPLGLGIPAAVFTFRRMSYHGDELAKCIRLVNFYERGLQRIDGEWRDEEEDGARFRDGEHPFAEDLNLFGKGSLYQLLCTARTAAGRSTLAEYLRNEADRDEILARQQAVAELTPNWKLREGVALLGEWAFHDFEPDSFSRWIDSPASPSGGITRWLAAGLAIFNVTCIALMVATPAHWQAFLPPLFVSALLGSMIGQRWIEENKRILELVRPLHQEVRMFRQAVNLLTSLPGESPKLEALRRRVPPELPLRRLERLLDLVVQREKDQFYHLSLLLLGGTQLTIALEDWRSRHGTALADALAAWGEFESLVAIAGHAFEHPDYVLPEVVEGAPAYFARDLAHPLLDEPVANDVDLSQERRFLVLSGSNMAGKSTYLRAIGLNAVLARLGSPVRASSLRFAPVPLCASIGVADSLLESKSRFLAEVSRVRLAVDMGTSTGVLYLFDEIFSGTNSEDRRIAVERVISALEQSGCIGLLSSHDLALTAVPSLPGMRGGNVHFSNRPGGGPLDFDYRLKEGVVTNSNALAILEMVGLGAPEGTEQHPVQQR